MNESSPDGISRTEQERYEAGRITILQEVMEGTYDPETSLEMISERTGLGAINVCQLFGGLRSRGEVSWERSPEGLGSRLVLTESGREHLGRYMRELC